MKENDTAIELGNKEIFDCLMYEKRINELVDTNYTLSLALEEAEEKLIHVEKQRDELQDRINKIHLQKYRGR